MAHAMEIVIVSLPDKEKLVAEIYFGSEQWAELSREKESFVLEIYPRRTGEPWSFNLENVLDILQQAKHELRDEGLG